MGEAAKVLCWLLKQMWKSLVIAIVWMLPLLADDRSKETLGSTHTERFEVAEAGTIRIENSFGEVDIDGWDRPEVEVTVVRSSEQLSDPKESAEAQRRLDSVQVTVKQDGNDVVISTAYPPRNAFVHPLSRRSDIEIRYHIQAPRSAKLVIDHNRGGVNVFDMSGPIHATVINGQITLTLAAGDRYAIDAQCKTRATFIPIFEEASISAGVFWARNSTTRARRPRRTFIFACALAISSSRSCTARRRTDPQTFSTSSSRATTAYRIGDRKIDNKSRESRPPTITIANGL